MSRDVPRLKQTSTGRAENPSSPAISTAKNTQNSESPIQEGTFVNIETGEMRAYFANPPTTDNWRLLSPRLDLTIEQAKRIVGQGGYAPLDPAKLHF